VSFEIYQIGVINPILWWDRNWPYTWRLSR